MTLTTPETHPLAIEEFKSCKQQILEDIKWMDQIEIYSVGAIAAVYVFAFTQAKPLLIEFICFIPPFIALAGALRTLALDQTIRVLNDYLVSIEGSNSTIGYTGYYRKHRSFVMKASRYVVWGTLLLLTFGFEYLVIRHGAFWTKGL